MSRFLKVKFSAEELKTRTTSEEGPFRLVRKKDKSNPTIKEKIKDKVAYSSLLCARIEDEVPGSHITMKEPFNLNNAKDKMRGYIGCLHNVRSSVVFAVEDFKDGSDLEFSVDFECFQCLKLDSKPQIAPVSSSSISASTSSSPKLASLKLQLNNAITPRFEAGLKQMNDFANRVYHKCLSEKNPEEFFEDNREEIGKYLMKGWLKGSRATQEDDEEMEESESEEDQSVREKSPEQPKTPSPVKTPRKTPKTPAMFDLTKKAAKRKAETQAKIAAKKQKEAEEQKTKEADAE